MSAVRDCKPFSGRGCGQPNCLRCARTKFIRQHPERFWQERGEPPCGWTWFVSLTLRENTSVPRLHGKFRHYCFVVAAQLQCHVLVAFAIGRQPHSGLPHVHAVISIPDRHVPPAAFGEECWRWEGHPAGDALVEPYNSEEGGIGYIVDHGEPTVAVACPEHRACHRNGRCRFAGAESWPRESNRGIGDDI